MTLNTAVWEVQEVPTQINLFQGSWCTALFKRGFQRDLLLLSTSTKRLMKFSWMKRTRKTSKDTVDGRNPAPVHMENIPLFIGFYTSQMVVSDFFHQQYDPFSNLRPDHVSSSLRAAHQTHLISASKKVHAGVTSPELVVNDIKWRLLMFFLEQEDFLSSFFPRFSHFWTLPQIVSLPTPFPAPRKKMGILLIITFKKETETEARLKRQQLVLRHPGPPAEKV